MSLIIFCETIDRYRLHTALLEQTKEFLLKHVQYIYSFTWDCNTFCAVKTYCPYIQSELEIPFTLWEDKLLVKLIAMPTENTDTKVVVMILSHLYQNWLNFFFSCMLLKTVILQWISFLFFVRNWSFRQHSMLSSHASVYPSEGTAYKAEC